MQSAPAQTVRVCFCESPLCEVKPERYGQDIGVFDACDGGWGRDALGRGAPNVSNQFAKATLSKNGSVHASGDPRYGGDVSEVKLQPARIVRSLYGNNYAFAALKAHGRAVSWGEGRKQAEALARCH